MIYWIFSPNIVRKNICSFFKQHFSNFKVAKGCSKSKSLLLPGNFFG